MWDVDFWVAGEPASAKNQRRIVTISGLPRLIKSAKALSYCKSFEKQRPRDIELLVGDIALRIDVWYASRRPDLACMDLIMDLLQGVVYQNDRQVKASMSMWNLDKENPRCQVRARQISVDTSGSFGVSSFSQSQIWGVVEDQTSKR